MASQDSTMATRVVQRAMSLYEKVYDRVKSEIEQPPLGRERVSERKVTMLIRQVLEGEGEGSTGTEAQVELRRLAGFCGHVDDSTCQCPICKRVGETMRGDERNA